MPWEWSGYQYLESEGTDAGRSPGRVFDEPHFGFRALRSVMRMTPTGPRCKVCLAPFHGIGGRVAASDRVRALAEEPELL